MLPWAVKKSQQTSLLLYSGKEVRKWTSILWPQRGICKTPLFFPSGLNEMVGTVVFGRFRESISFVPLMKSLDLSMCLNSKIMELFTLLCSTHILCSDQGQLASSCLLPSKIPLGHGISVWDSALWIFGGRGYGENVGSGNCISESSGMV